MEKRFFHLDFSIYFHFLLPTVYLGFFYLSKKNNHQFNMWTRAWKSVEAIEKKTRQWRWKTIQFHEKWNQVVICILDMATNKWKIISFSGRYHVEAQTRALCAKKKLFTLTISWLYGFIGTKAARRKNWIVIRFVHFSCK